MPTLSPPPIPPSPARGEGLIVAAIAPDECQGVSLLWCYMLLALPMAMIGLPIYLHIPPLFSETYGISLGALGGVLFITRLCDTISDPLLGALSDRLCARGISRIRIMACVAPIFLLALIALVSPPMLPASAWLLLCLSLLYITLSALVVNYYALGLRLGEGEAAQRRISIRREGTMIFGIFLGTLLPAALMQRYGAMAGMQHMAYGVVLLACMLMPYGLHKLRSLAPETLMPAQRASWRCDVGALWRYRPVRSLYSVYFINALAGAIPATLMVYYMRDVLKLLPSQQGLVLAVYFLSAVLALPLWNALAAKVGALRCWQISMIVAALAFVPASFLGAADSSFFILICVATGATLGADMAMPASVVSAHIQQMHFSAGTTYGLYNLLSKLALAVAAACILPLLQAIGYSAQHDTGVTTLAYLYALVPAGIKLIAAWKVSRCQLLLEGEKP